MKCSKPEKAKCPHCDKMVRIGSSGRLVIHAHLWMAQTLCGSSSPGGSPSTLSDPRNIARSE